MNVCLAKTQNFFLGTSIETSVDAADWFLSVCGSVTVDMQSFNTQDLEMKQDLFALPETPDLHLTGHF
jgi:hypothetical protein